MFRLFKPGTLLARCFAERQLALRLTGTATSTEAAAAPLDISANIRHRRSNVEPRKLLENLNLSMTKFEQKVQRTHIVVENDLEEAIRRYYKFFKDVDVNNLSEKDKPTLATLNIMLLRCCGSPLTATPPSRRVELAGELWSMLKKGDLPVDTNHFNILLRVFNENLSKVDPKKILASMAEQNVTPDKVTYQRILHQYCLQGDIDGVTETLETMKAADYSLNEQVFASLIIGYTKAGDNQPTIEEIFNIMKSSGIQPGSYAYSATLMAIASKLPTEGMEALTKYYQQMLDERVQLRSSEAIDVMLHLWPHRSIESVKKIFNEIVQSQMPMYDSRMKMAAAAIQLSDFKLASEIYHATGTFCRSPQKQQAITFLQLLIQAEQCPPEILVEEALKMRESGLLPDAVHFTYFNCARLGRKDKLRPLLNELKNMGAEVRATYYWPLFARAENEDELLSILSNDFHGDFHWTEIEDTLRMWIWPNVKDTKKVHDACSHLNMRW